MEGPPGTPSLLRPSDREAPSGPRSTCSLVGLRGGEALEATFSPSQRAPSLFLLAVN